MFLRYYFFTFCCFIAFSFASANNSDMRFIENIGQWNNNIQFNTRLNQGNIYFEKHCFTFVLIERKNHSKDSHNHSTDIKNGHHFKIHFKGANENIHFTYSGKSEHYYNYFLGNDKSKWKSHVHEYESITYRNLYNGIDMAVYGDKQNMKYEYYVAPNANPNLIQVKYEGVDDIQLKNNNLYYNTSVTEIIELAPYAYQIINGDTIKIACNYQLNKNNNVVSFSFPNSYDKRYELVIDPTLIFSRLSNSTSDNFGFTATYDDQGRAYAGGIVFGAQGQYPTTTGAFDETYNGGVRELGTFFNQAIDIGISCYNASTGALIYGTYIGGSNNEIPNSMIVNNIGELVVLGTTGSSNFPINGLNIYDDSFNNGVTYNFSNNGVYFSNGSDIVVFKLSSNGNALTASTFIGGSGNDGLNDDLNSQTEYDGTDLHFNYGDGFRGEVIVDEDDNIYVASSTNSSDFPTVGTASSQNGVQDAVTFKLNSTMSNLIYSRYIGGSNDDAAYSLKIDNNNNVFVVGGTKSNDFPIVGNTININYQNGVSDGYICKLDNVTGNILASTFIGTNSYDQVYFVDLDESDNVYVVGQTLGNYPVFSSLYSNTNGKQFIHKLNNDLNSTIYSTVFGSGGNNIDLSPTAFLVDICERVYVSGWGGNTNENRNPNNTNSFISGMPTTSNAFKQNTDGSDFYFFVLNKNASGILYGTYFGGNADEHVDGGTSRFNDQGIVYQAICAACGGETFQTSPGFSSNSSSTNCNLGIMKFNIDLPITLVDINAFPTYTGCIPLTVNFESILNDVSTFEWDFGDGSVSSLPNPTYTYTDTGVFNVRLIGSDPNSCNEADTAYLNVYASDDTITTNQIDSFYVNCDDYSIYVKAPLNSTSTYNWHMGDGTIYIDAGNEITHQYSDGNVYEIILHVEDTTKCDANGYDTLIIDLPPLIEAEINSDFGCVNTLFALQNNSNENAETFIWDLGNGETSNEYEPTIQYNAVDDYTVYLTVIDSGTCNIIDMDTNIISIIPAAVANFRTDSNYYIYPDLVQFTNYSYNYNQFEWNFGDGKYDSTNIDPLHFYENIYDFSPCLTVWNEGCLDTICKDIYIDFIPLIDVPNAFSPNGDGINDVIKVEGVGITQLSFKIYNRWGELVYEGFDQNEGWDGYYKGKLQELEVYTYQVNAILLDGSNKILKGNITLVK